jgi:hypothetical protein
VGGMANLWRGKDEPEHRNLKLLGNFGMKKVVELSGGLGAVVKTWIMISIELNPHRGRPTVFHSTGDP